MKDGPFINKIPVAFYQEPNGNEPVRKWLKNLDDEIRLIIGEDARLIFIMHDNKIVLLHGIIKKSQETPKQDKDLAKKRAKNVRKSMHEKKQKT